MHDRRDFLKTSAGTLAALLSQRGLSAWQVDRPAGPITPPVGMAVVGLGTWGREILAALARLPSAKVVAICDTYPAAIRRSSEIAPGAREADGFQRLLDSPSVEALVIATPTPTHAQIAIAAIDAGKHVYCEAPLAASIGDARAIAAAAALRPRQIVQGGLQGRSNQLYRHVSQFVESGVLGDVALVNAQWNKRESWRRPGPTSDRERALNWRLERESPGLMGEVGIHQIDLMLQYLGQRPVRITGTGAIATWRDGRETPDTIACLIEFPRARANYRATLASSFGGTYTVFQGSNSALFMKESRSWMVKEADSPLLGWEVYARKESVHDETGIAMVADATKLLEAGKEPGKDGSSEPEIPPLQLALEAFIRSIRSGTPPPCNATQAYESTVVALKANEAVLGNTHVNLQPTDFALRAI
jgi:predicted dehydrogenase